jgi:two-component system, cell cycle response regulator
MVTEAEILNASILIVDDMPANVELLEYMLRNAGYTNISMTHDPRKVCDLQREHHHSLILLDMQMPGMDGFGVMEALKESEADDYVPVLVITAQPMHKIRALGSGAKDFISKPFDVTEMLLRVHNMLEMRLLHMACRDHGKEQESLALTDSLTGLANRRLLIDRLAMEIAHSKRSQCPMALLCLDLDGFKEINNTLGHAAGDVLLKMVAERMVSTMREEDTVARIGGDEFVIVLRASGDAAAQIADKLIEMVSRPYAIEGHTAAVTVSVGIGVYPQHGHDAEALLKSSDAALYEAKRAGKNISRVAAQ